MNDLSIIARSVPEQRWIWIFLIELNSWARMEFKLANSSSQVLNKKCFQDQLHFKTGENIIPTPKGEAWEEFGEVVQG